MQINDRDLDSIIDALYYASQWELTVADSWKDLAPCKVYDQALRDSALYIRIREKLLIR